MKGSSVILQILLTFLIVIPLLAALDGSDSAALWAILAIMMVPGVLSLGQRLIKRQRSVRQVSEG
ncbi:hypothetical protein HMH05_11155 [Pseudomonas sp. SbB1]|uniref:hypothetical protein n=1 Tax=Pseudomonas TaxID=286 RepID=UPI001237586D|nr:MULTISPECIES: hypothetical protein [Pseudomonas]MBP0708923.1 hypothetical protein [Pseudomonas sp. T34]MCK2188363.1 hypothetical protein [Pseudomonas sp. MB04B]MDD2083978.1 hypothetical protein [Pseudomonas putida]MDD2093120.1 hypothetical protein [Pseudomonas putida]NOG88355.1 hypothetical protein [Pseudomonas sp. SbB1]